MSRGNVLKVFFIIAISALLFSCNKDNDEKPTDNDDVTKNSKKEFFAESSDPLLMRCTKGNVIVEYYGEKSENGLPSSLDYVYVNDKDNNDETFMYFENENLKIILTPHNFAAQIN